MISQNKLQFKHLADGHPPGQNTSLIMPQGTPWSFKHTTEMDILKKLLEVYKIKIAQEQMVLAIEC